LCCEGIELRKVEESGDSEKQGGTTAGTAAGGGGVGGLFDVQMILEMRRRVLECEDDSDEPGDEEEWDD